VRRVAGRQRTGATAPEPAAEVRHGSGKSPLFSYKSADLRFLNWTRHIPDKEIFMRTPANIAGHPIHPMLVTIPIGLWIFSLVADLVALRSGAPQTWALVAYYAMIGGIVGALAAALPGLVDLLSLHDRAIKKTAIIHMSINLSIVVLYVVNAWMRHNAAGIGGVPLGLSVLAIAMLLVSGWLGGKMVYLAAVGVSTEQAPEQPRQPQPPQQPQQRRHA
jgi:uncharacterized membrane protein